MKKINNIFIGTVLMFLLITINSNGQIYLGAGNDDNITVFASGAENNSFPRNTLDGGGLDASLMETSRFLSQATFGVTMEDIEAVTEMGIETWMDNQLNLPVNDMTTLLWENWDVITQGHLNSFNRYLAEYISELCYEYNMDETGTVPEPTPLTQQEVDDLRMYFNEDMFGPASFEFNITWSHHAMTSADQLRQRMAYALSQILVISSQSDLGDHAESLTAFYDILQKHAFGNYRDLLLDVTFSPAMGFYLSHLNNPKAIPEENIHPDENYAREVMQLFSIGLYELNIDGTRKVDANGNEIPTYNNADIKEMARVFTGLGPGELDPTMDIDWTDEAYFGLDLYPMSKTDPLIMYQDWHDEGSKSLLNDLEIPSGMEGLSEIEMAIDYLFNHPNVGPFICRQMIQRLITSNPSREYISRVATVFNNNGQGVRGDMAAVAKAIFMDPEARTCEGFQDPYNGKLSEPLLRTTRFIQSIPHFAFVQDFEIHFRDYSCGGIDTLAYDYVPYNGEIRYWNNGYNLYDDVKQYPLMSPTVFNFYLPDHQPVGEIGELGLVAPEYKIHDSSTAINYMNQIWMLSNPWYNLLWYNWLESYGMESIMPNFDDWALIYNEDPENLINYLDVVLTNGKLSDATRSTIHQFLEDAPTWIDDLGMARSITYLILISPDYTIDK
ncbi:MAG: DUF1800 family protein [Saprospiraceae bacterium]|nr:DUF1800 domain-containing protein [Bacteroidia bacterium]NNE16670.1 DUF1800 family protein [Saprospiraceae bacterium]NNL92146.1 DUF1800 family protein [Saprospiraceae bacterium]